MRVIGEDIWAAEGSMKMPLMQLTLRSTVIHLGDNSLMVISPIAPTPKWVEQIHELGVVKYVVAPNCLHHLYLPKFAVNFPEAELWGPADLFDKRADIRFNDALDVSKKMPWSEYVDMIVVKAKSPVFEEFIFFHKKSQTLIVTDLMFNYHHFNNWVEALFAKVNGGYKKLAMTRMAKMSYRDSVSLQAFAEKVDQWKPKNLIVAHGDVILGNAYETLQEPLLAMRS